jgi:L-threonylcarbamoyladenylate synthase
MSTSTRATAHKVRGRLAPALLRTLAADLRAGSIAIFPTETVYGLGTSAFAGEGIRRIYTLKGRRWNKPLALLVPTLESAAPLLESIPKEALKLVDAFCPGPLTLVFKASALGKLVTGGLETIGVRIPDHPIALAILRAVGIPLATTSVNRSGEKPAASGAASRKLFGGQVDWLLDGGVCRVKKPSSVVDMSHYPFTILREGAVPKRALERILFQ